MSKPRVASRPHPPKPAEVVPISPAKPWGPLEHARADFEIQSEMVTTHLNGLRILLDAWMDFEGQNHVLPPTRDAALGLLGKAVEDLGERLEAKRMAWREAEKAEAAKKSA
jgi:hypothetical protein